MKQDSMRGTLLEYNYEVILMKKQTIILSLLLIIALLLAAGCSVIPVYYEVNFMNYDGSVYATQSVRRHRDAADIILPDGYAMLIDENGQAFTAFCTFKGWGSDLIDVTENMDVEPIFEISDISYDTFVVIFKDPDGLTVSTQFVKKGEDAVAPELTPPEGQIVVWDKPFTNVQSNLVVNAMYVFETMDYIFDAGEGEFADGSKTIVFKDVYYLDPVDESTVEIPVLADHTFNGWLKTVEEGGKVLRFTAQYKPVEYTVTFYDHNRQNIIAQISVPYGSSALELAPEAPEREGFVFIEWVGADLSFITGNVEVYAVYEGRDVEYSFYGFNGELLYSYTIPYGSAVVYPVAPEIENYTFVGWKFSEIDKSGEVWKVRADAEYLYGVYYKVAFVVNGQLFQAQFVAENGCAVDPETIPGVDLTIIPEGYRIVGWEMEDVDAEGNVITLPFDFNTPVTRNMTVRAILEPIE